MASRGKRGNGTMHTSRHNGHGRTEPRYRFAIKSRLMPDRQPGRKSDMPWFLKSFGSRPAEKRPAPMHEAA